MVEGSDESEYANEVIELFFVEYLQKPLLQLISDPLEKCREVSTNILMVRIIKNMKYPHFLQFICFKMDLYKFVNPEEALHNNFIYDNLKY